MMHVKEAFAIAKEYFTSNLGNGSVAKATMSENAWFFISGEINQESIGNVVISVDKQTGEITLVDLLSDDGFALIRATTPIELPFKD